MVFENPTGFSNLSGLINLLFRQNLPSCQNVFFIIHSKKVNSFWQIVGCDIYHFLVCHNLSLMHGSKLISTNWQFASVLIGDENVIVKSPLFGFGNRLKTILSVLSNGVSNYRQYYPC